MNNIELAAGGNDDDVSENSIPMQLFRKIRSHGKAFPILSAILKPILLTIASVNYFIKNFLTSFGVLSVFK